MESGDPLVSADWLKSNLDRPSLKLLDATWVPPFLKDRDSGRTCYDKGHIPGAVYFDIDEIAEHDTNLSHMLPDIQDFGPMISALGIGDGDEVVVYDSNNFYASARVWWTLRAMGLRAVAVLDGGLNAWQEIGGAIEIETPTPQPKEFTPMFLRRFVRNMAEMSQHIETGDATILDARDLGRFNGTSAEPRAGLPSGHMPGSYCVPASSLLEADGKMKSPEQLANLLSVYNSGTVITTCGSGVSAAIIALALARIGNYDAALYDGSWSEWAAHPENPIATAI
nr:sulfurtransferase [Hyphomonas sp. Mor2]